MSNPKIALAIGLILTAKMPTLCAADCDPNNITFDCLYEMVEDLQRQTLPYPVPQTGQTLCYDSEDKTTDCNNNVVGQDGKLQKGFPLSVPRFTDNLDGTVTDNLTGLIWLQDANCFDSRKWDDARTKVYEMNTGVAQSCNTTQTGWRLPNIRELHSLINYQYSNPALSNAEGDQNWNENDPFLGVQSGAYWSATSPVYNTSYAWVVLFNNGYVNAHGKTYTNYVWPVRGGQ